MQNRKINEKKIAIKNNIVVTRQELFESNEKFHKEQAKLPFEEKIKILVRLQEMTRYIKREIEKSDIWKI